MVALEYHYLQLDAAQQQVYRQIAAGVENLRHSIPIAQIPFKKAGEAYRAADLDHPEWGVVCPT